MAEVLSAGAFATEGERRAAAELRKLPEPWLVICNKMVVTNDGRTYEVDFIVVGDRWVFVIDEKSWCGKITGNDQKWFRADNHSERSPLNKAEAIAKPLAGNLRACLGYQLHPERRQHVFTSFVFVHDLLAEPFHDPSTFQLQ